MATTVNFTSLLSDLANYLERGGSELTDPTVFNQLPRLINAAERKLAQDLKLLGQIEVLVGNPPNGLQVGNPVLAKPDRWRATVSWNIGTGTGNNTRKFLFTRAKEYVQAYWPNPTLTDEPEFYADYDLQHWLIGPTPAAAYPFEITCYMEPPLLSDVNQSNFWSDYAPNALLYGALLEATPFLKDDPRIAVWKDAWATELATLSGQDVQRMMDRSIRRTTV